MLKIIHNDIKEHKKLGFVYLGYMILALIGFAIIKTQDVKNAVYVPFILTSVLLGILTLIYIIYYIYTSTYSSRAYLTFKLGISRKKVILSKLILSIFVILISYVIVGISAYLIFMTDIDYASIKESYTIFFTPEANSNILFTQLISFIVINISAVLSISLCLALGHMMNKNKILASVLFYVGLKFAKNIISMIVGVYLIMSNFHSEEFTGFAVLNNSAVIIGINIFILIIKLGAILYISDKKLNV